MPRTEEQEDVVFTDFMAGDDPERLRAIVETRTAPPSTDGAFMEEDLRAIPVAPSEKKAIPISLTIRVNGFERRESEFRCGTFQTVLREIPEPLRRRIETLLRSFPTDERVEIQLGAEANVAWHDLAWYLFRRERYASMRVQRRHHECTCIDCESSFPASQPWCINAKCPGAEAYRRITGKTPGATVTNRGQAAPTTTASEGGMRPPKKRRTD